MSTIPALFSGERAPMSNSEPEPAEEGGNADLAKDVAKSAPDTGTPRRKVTWTRITISTSMTLQKKQFVDVVDTERDEHADTSVDAVFDTGVSQERTFTAELERAREGMSVEESNADHECLSQAHIDNMAEALTNSVMDV